MRHCGRILVTLVLLRQLTAVAAGKLRKTNAELHFHSEPHPPLQSTDEHASDYVKDGNGKTGSDPKNNSDVHKLQTEEKFHDNYTTDDRPAPAEPKEDHKAVHEEHHHIGEEHEHGGSPGAGHGVMVPRTHVTEKEDHHNDHHWAYSAPKEWGDGYEFCDGKSQSPINIDTSKVKAPAAQKQTLAVHYKALDSRVLVDHGHNVQVNGKFGTLELPDGVYDVAQFHFHFPSEHEIDGKLAAGEIHIVHQKQGSHGTDDLAVIGILLDVGKIANEKHDAEIEFLANLGFAKKLPKEGEERNISKPVDLNTFSDQLAGDFYHYDGSLTTPPCSQTVHWYVLKQTAKVTTEILDSFKAIFPSPANNRPVASLNGRVVVQSSFETGPNEFSEAKAAKAAKSGALRVGVPGCLAYALAAAGFVLGLA